jgi:hypothetical protein
MKDMWGSAGGGVVRRSPEGLVLGLVYMAKPLRILDGTTLVSPSLDRSFQEPPWV